MDDFLRQILGMMNQNAQPDPQHVQQLAQAGQSASPYEQANAAAIQQRYNKPELMEGRIAPGNIDLDHLPVVYHDDGTYSGVKSMSYGESDGEHVIPTVSRDGRMLDPEAAIADARKSGRTLGIFKTPEQADKYAQTLHDQLAQQYEPMFQRGNPTTGPANPMPRLMPDQMPATTAQQRQRFTPNESADQFTQRQQASGYNVPSTKGAVSDDPAGNALIALLGGGVLGALNPGARGLAAADSAAESAADRAAASKAPGLLAKLSGKGYDAERTLIAGPSRYSVNVNPSAGLEDTGDAWVPRILDILHQSKLLDEKKLVEVGKAAARNAVTNVVKGTE